MRVILIDGRNAAFRFCWAYRALTDDTGSPTGAVYGLYRMLIGLKKKYPDARFVVVWDGKRTANNWRTQLWAGYKNRGDGPVPKTVKDVVDQIPRMDEALQHVGIPAIQVPDVEADDLVGMFTTVCLKERWQPVIYSSDMDYAQLMQYGVQLIRGDKRDAPFRLTPAREICERFCCSLENVLRVRALMGDQSDKIPKVMRGLGIETAAKLIEAGFDPATNEGCGVVRMLVKKPSVDFSTDVSRNYRLMRIVRSWNDSVYAQQCRQIKEQLQIARQAVKDPWKIDSRSLTKFLVSGQYVSLLKERKVLMTLNT